MHIEKIHAFTRMDKIEREELLSHLFGLTKTEAKAYFSALGESTVNVKELSDKLGKDRTTTQRIVSKLLENELMSRQKINLKLGGIKYRYSATDFGLIKNKMHQKLELWHETMRSKVNEL